MDRSSADSGEFTRPRKTTLRTFRLSEDLAHALEAEAEKQGTTLNALAASILLKHVDWDAKAAQFGYIPTYKPIFTWLLQAVDEESLSRLGRTVVPAMWKEMAAFWFKDSSEERILDLLTARGRYLRYAQTEVKKKDLLCTIVTHHDLGPRWSVVLESAFDELVRNSFHARPTIRAGGTVVTVEFSVP